MKKIFLFCVVLLFAGLNSVTAQFANVNPIPFYNYQITNTYAGFQEPGPDSQTDEKRDMNVEVTTSSRDGIDESRVFATVWIVKKNGSKTLGPYTVYPNELLSVEISSGKWGVIIQCAWDVNVSVWTSAVQSQTLNGIPENNINPFFTLRGTFPII
jgi:hypothetical protein